jgi:hypothetical protein
MQRIIFKVQSLRFKSRQLTVCDYTFLEYKLNINIEIEH